MEKFEAGNKFYELLLKNPKDFIVERKSEREYTTFVIRHNMKPVTLIVDVNLVSNSHVARRHHTGESILYVHPEVLKNIVVWAKEQLEIEKENQEVQEDNNCISLLMELYK